MLRHLIELVHGLAHLANALGLLGCGGADFANDVGHTLHAGHDVAHGAAGAAHQTGAAVYLLDRVVDQLLDLFGRLGAALGQGAHLASHYGKATPLLAGAGRFHSRVQRQDVGLESNAVNHANDVADLGAAGVDGPHGLHHLGYHGTAALGDLGRRGCQLAGRVGRIAGLATGPNRPSSSSHQCARRTAVWAPRRCCPDG